MINSEDMLKLYTEMDITINEIPTEVKVNQETVDFIYQSIGRVISYGFSDTDATIRINIPDKLITDIRKTIDYFKVKNFWENMQFPAKPKKKYDETLYSDTGYFKMANPASEESMSFPSVVPTTINGKIHTTDETYIMYNTIYNLALVVDKKNMTVSIDDFIETYPEFTCIVKSDEIAHSPDEIKTAFKLVFHKKSFETQEDVLEKFNAFKSLYNISNDKSEKQRVQKYISSTYIISTDFDKRMKANDIYKELINYMCIPYEESSSFKKRLAGYLTEFGLQKRRFSDAYYFYGLEKRVQTSMYNLVDIEAKRNLDKKEWLKSSQTCIAHTRVIDI